MSGYDTPAVTGKDFKDPHSWRDPNNPGHRTELNDQAAGPAIATRRAAVERLKLKKNVVLEEYKAAAAMAQRPVKVSLIGPDRIAQRFAWERSQAVYKDIDEFVADVVAIQRQMIGELVDAGCRYVHIDAPGFTAYVDKVSLDKRVRRLDRMRGAWRGSGAEFDRAMHAENAIIEGFPGVTFGLHICRAIRAASTLKVGFRDSGIGRMLRQHRRKAVQRAHASKAAA